MSGPASRSVLWRGLDGWRAEACVVAVGEDGLRAGGTQIGTDPLPYRLDYVLDAGDRFRTRRFEATTRGDGWERRLLLTREDGAWRCAADGSDPPELGEPGGDPADLAAAEEIDLGLSPLTNSTPVLRAGLHRHPGRVELVAAWISVPELIVRPSRQRYDHVAPGRVRYTDLGLFAGFTREITVDDEGLVTHYPGLALLAGPVEPA